MNEENAVGRRGRGRGRRVEGGNVQGPEAVQRGRGGQGRGGGHRGGGSEGRLGQGNGRGAFFGAGINGHHIPAHGRGQWRGGHNTGGGAPPAPLRMATRTAILELQEAHKKIMENTPISEESCRRLHYAIESQNQLPIDDCSSEYIMATLNVLAGIVSVEYAPTLATMQLSHVHSLKTLLRLACTDKGQICKGGALFMMTDSDSVTTFTKLASVLTALIKFNDAGILLHLPGGIEGIKRVQTALSRMIPGVEAEFNDLTEAMNAIVADVTRPLQRGGQAPLTMPITFRTHPIKPRPQDLITPPAPVVPIVLDRPLVSLEAHFNSLFHGYWYDFMKPLYQAILESHTSLTGGGLTAAHTRRRSGHTPIYRDLFVRGFEASKKGLDVHFSFKLSRVLSKKQLRTGSLVVLSSDSFNQNFLFGIVGNVESTGKRGDSISVGINFFDPQSALQHILSPLALVESPSFYEEAQHILKAIQTFNFETLAFTKTLLAQPDMGDEQEAEEMDEFDEEKALAGLDPSQDQAMRLIMRSRFPIIQGPPGTGKTYIGVKAVIAALDTSLASSPIIILCYTNHALDSFLTDIMNVGHPDLIDAGRIIRLGRSSKDPAMERLGIQRRMQFTHSFQKARDAVIGHCQNFSDIHPPELQDFRKQLKDDQRKLFHEVTELKEQYDQLEQEYHALNNKTNRTRGMTQDLKKKEAALNEMYVELEELMSGQEDPENYMLVWVGDLNVQVTGAAEGEEEEFIDRDNVRRMEGVDDIHRHSLDVGQFWVYYERFKERIDNGQLTVNTETSSHMRAALVYHFITRHRQNCLAEMGASVVRFNEESEGLELRTWEGCLPQLEGAKIIAATTTGMSKFGFVVGKTNPKLVVLEEAAEIAEPHALAALFPTCKKVIQIGDHQQLRPKVNEFDSAKKHHMDVSLMERMIRSGGMEYATLCTQRRMRPEIAQYTTPLYQERLLEHGGLHTHEVALGRPALTSLGSSVIFLNHTMPEQTDEMSQSKYNPGEADFTVQLAEYLSKQMETDGLDASSITLLTPYTGQVRQLRKRLDAIKLPVRVASIDDFQGEENDVIILSLVRSTEIGFLREDNRICVALSRARRGMIVMGNLDFMEKAKVGGSSTYWHKAIGIARESHHYMDALPLHCSRHGRTALVQPHESIRNASPSGGCHQRCGLRRKCGHACDRNCHTGDCDDEPCDKPCGRKCERGHPCPLRCADDCRCVFKVEKVFPCASQHKAVVACHVEPLAMNCPRVVERGHDHCSHYVMAACGAKNIPMCTDRCSIPLRGCKHECEAKCGSCKGSRFSHPPCSKKCERPLLCGHVCGEVCATICRPCVVACQSECPHGKCPQTCGDPCTPCAEPCGANSECTHGERRCRKQCGEPCDVAPCSKRCQKRLPDCTHQCQGVCGEPCPYICFECNEFDTELHDPIFCMADKNSLFLKLTPCGHEIALEVMDMWVENRQKESLPFLDCPQCKARITHSHRYQSTLFEGFTANLFRSAQRWKSEKLDEAEKLRVSAVDERREILKIKENLNKNSDAKCPFGDAVAAFLEGTKQLDNPPPKNKKERDANKVFPTWCRRVTLAALEMRLLHASMQNNIHLVTTCQELDDLARVPSTDCTVELRRMVQVKILRGHGIRVEERMALLEGPDGEDYINNRLLEIVSPPTSEELKAIHAALVGSGQIVQAGAWNRCNCGYIYAIGDCGGATVVTKCPVCRRDIGGTSHRNLNRHVGDLDGSNAHAWPQ